MKKMLRYGENVETLQEMQKSYELQVVKKPTPKTYMRMMIYYVKVNTYTQQVCQFLIEVGVKDI